MSGFKGLRRTLVGALAAASLITGPAAAVAQGPVDPVNPTCPQSPNWSAYPEMRLTVEEVNGRPVLLAEGRIDDNLVPRLRAALDSFTGDEIWVRSPGGNARVGNEAGRLIREASLQTRIPDGWACFSACNFVFMGGIARFVDPGGLFIVHMFTHTGDRAAIHRELLDMAGRLRTLAAAIAPRKGKRA